MTNSDSPDYVANASALLEALVPDAPQLALTAMRNTFREYYEYRITISTVKQRFNKLIDGIDFAPMKELLQETIGSVPNYLIEAPASDSEDSDSNQFMDNSHSYDKRRSGSPFGTDNYEQTTKRAKTHSWTLQEDQKLLEAIDAVGLDNWSQVAKLVGSGRTRSQCSQRWNRSLNPKISKTKWTREEEVNLLRLVRKHGSKSWMNISRIVGNRTDVQCRFHYNQILNRTREEGPSIEELLKDDEIKEPQENPFSIMFLLNRPHNNTSTI